MVKEKSVKEMEKLIKKADVLLGGTSQSPLNKKEINYLIKKVLLGMVCFQRLNADLLHLN